MKQIFLILTTILLTVGSSTLAQNNPFPITAGRFFMQKGVSNSNNAQIQTPNFTVISRVSANGLSGWHICALDSYPSFCKAGKSFSLPTTVQLGFCGACSPAQFAFGTFTINGKTYENVYFNGQLQFSQTTFLVAPAYLTKRKGFVRFRKPFTMTGNLQVCRVVTDPISCRENNIIFSGQIAGQGTLTVTTKIAAEKEISPRPFLIYESIEYQFEQ